MARSLSNTIWDLKSRLRWRFDKATGKADPSFKIAGNRISLHCPHRTGSSTLTMDADDLRTLLDRENADPYDVVFMNADLAKRALAEYDTRQEALRKEREQQVLQQARRIKTLARRRR